MRGPPTRPAATDGDRYDDHASSDPNSPVATRKYRGGSVGAADLMPSDSTTDASAGEDWSEDIDIARKLLPAQAAAATAAAAGCAAVASDSPRHWRTRLRSPWSMSLLTLATTCLAFILLLTILRSFQTLQRDPKGCAMSYIFPPIFIDFPDFDTEHTRLAGKYSLYLHREQSVDEEPRVKGIPVLFVPGNAGSYKQVRSFASEAANYFHRIVLQDPDAVPSGQRPLDFFSVDFNEDFTAFHGQTLLDQAEYLNEAVAYILSLYHKPEKSIRDPSLPDPTSVIIVGHSMGGMVARTMLTLPNYQANSINTIITLSAPHARPPVSADADIVLVYKRTNDYWRQAYSQKWANNNPLWHVTLVSIAGGGLDTVVPSDYASINSIVPKSHGFTVFTAAIPRVWTGMDHLELTFCDQFRKVLIRTLFNIVDVNRPSQTRPRAERMSVFKRWFLTGLEDIAERALPHQDANILLTLDGSNDVMSERERLVLSDLGKARKPKAHLLRVPLQVEGGLERLTILTNKRIDTLGEDGTVGIFFCSKYTLQPGEVMPPSIMDLHLAEGSTGHIRLVCKDGAVDALTLPASEKGGKHPYESTHTFNYLEYNLEDISEHQFVAIVEKAAQTSSGWVIAEFCSKSRSLIAQPKNLWQLLLSGLQVTLQPQRPMVQEIQLPAVRSSLLSYRLSVHRQDSVGREDLFQPLLRQHISTPYESKFFVNVREANVNLHGVSPYMPPSLRAGKTSDGLSLQFWTDPSAHTEMTVSLRIDVLGSMGKLYMRYRIAFAAFPLLVVALVVRHQFKVYDEAGIFVDFSSALDKSLRGSVPLLALALTFFGASLATSSHDSTSMAPDRLLHWSSNATETVIDYTKNDLLLGFQDPFFWFLVPLFGMVGVGICVAVNYALLAITTLLAAIYSVSSVALHKDEQRRLPALLATLSLRSRVLVTGLTILLVSTCIPYHLAYVILCVVQLSTSVRGLSSDMETRSLSSYNFRNYAHSMLLLMLWILPMNLLVVLTWVRNISLRWLTPFSITRNLLCIVPLIVMVELLSAGQMVPRVTGHLRHVSSLLFFIVAGGAAIYGVTYAYLLHYLINGVAAWLVILQLSKSTLTVTRLTQLLSGSEVIGDSSTTKKRP